MPPTATLPATPQSFHIALTSALEPLGKAIQVCAVANPDLAVFTVETPDSHLTPENTDMILSIGPATDLGGYSAQIGQERILVILHPDNPVGSLSGEALVSLFNGKTSNWKMIIDFEEEVQPWVYEENNEIRQHFEAVTLEGETISPEARLATDPAAMIAGVAAQRGAIGYLPQAWLNTKVRAAQISLAIQTRLSQPVLAWLPDEPVDAPRSFLSCLQSGEGHDRIEEAYNDPE